MLKSSFSFFRKGMAYWTVSRNKELYQQQQQQQQKADANCLSTYIY